MKNMKKIVFIILILFLVVIISNISFAKYSSLISNIKGEAIIAEPIIICERDNVIKSDFNKESVLPEYKFSIKNYLQDENGIKINEVDFYYNIEIVNSNENFPVEYELYDCETGNKIELLENKTEFFNIAKGEKEDKNFKLLLKWNNNKQDKLSEFNNIKILIEVIQKKI